MFSAVYPAYFLLPYYVTNQLAYLTVNVVNCQQLSGIGLFEWAATNGVNGASMAGGTEIMFYGTGMSDVPQNFDIVFTSSKYSYSV